MMKMKLNKKIAGATAMLMISATMLGTSTFAWFTMNKTVTVTGMQMTTKVGSNLLISEDFVEANFKPYLTQSVSGLLEPVSTVNGVDYFYTVKAAADGHKLADGGDYVALTAPGNTDTAFKAAYGLGSTDPDPVGYIDYTFYLKATTSAGSEKVSMTKCDLYKMSGSGSGATKVALGNDDKAWRVAMFSQEVTASEASVGSLKTVLKLSGATNWTADSAVENATTVSAVTNHDAAANVGDAITTAGTTKYYKVVVRLWLEGEDQSCNSMTYAPLAEVPYKLDLRFDLIPSTDTTHPTSALESDITWDVTANPQPALQ